MKGYGSMPMAKSGMKGGKSSPRVGAAKGQGSGMGGYNAGAANKALRSVSGAPSKASYSCGAGMGKR